MALHLPCDQPRLKILSYISSPTPIYFCLVVVFTIITWQPSKAKLIFFVIFFAVQIVALNDGTTSPHLLLPPHTTYSTSTQSRTSIAGWLLCLFIRFHPFNSFTTSGAYMRQLINQAS